MYLALVPGLLIALALGIWSGSPAESASVVPLSEQERLASVYSVAAQATLTATTQVTGTAEVEVTSAITSTATVTGTTGPVPLPTGTPVPQASMRWNPFDWRFLTEVPRPPLGPLGWIYTALMLGLLGAGGYLYFVKRNEWKRTNSVLKRAADKWATLGMWVGGLGLLFALFRLTDFAFFNLRIWFYSHLLALLAVAGWFYYWYRTTYPRQMARYQKAQRQRQYMPGAAKKAGGRQQPAAGSRQPSVAAAAPTEGSATGTEATPGAATNAQRGQQNRKRRRR